MYIYVYIYMYIYKYIHIYASEFRRGSTTQLATALFFEVYAIRFPPAERPTVVGVWGLRCGASGEGCRVSLVLHFTHPGRG
jgi:hypothetical protein